MSNAAYELALTDLTLTDPGDGNKIVVDRNPATLMLSCGSGETRTLLTPSQAGVRLVIKLLSGTCTTTEPLGISRRGKFGQRVRQHPTRRPKAKKANLTVENHTGSRTSKSWIL